MTFLLLLLPFRSRDDANGESSREIANRVTRFTLSSEISGETAFPGHHGGLDWWGNEWNILGKAVNAGAGE